MGKTSKYTGVSWNKRRRVWVACISIDKLKCELGGFIDERMAAIAYDKKAIEIGRKTNILKRKV